jgi:hypothetical protein
MSSFDVSGPVFCICFLFHPHTLHDLISYDSLVGMRLVQIMKLLTMWFSLVFGYELDDRWFESRQGMGIFLFITVSIPALRPTQAPIQWAPGALSLGIKRTGREADHSPSYSAEITKAWSCISTSPIRLHGVVLYIMFRAKYAHPTYVSLSKWRTSFHTHL